MTKKKEREIMMMHCVKWLRWRPKKEKLSLMKRARRTKNSSMTSRMESQEIWTMMRGWPMRWMTMTRKSQRWKASRKQELRPGMDKQTTSSRARQELTQKPMKMRMKTMMKLTSTSTPTSKIRGSRLSLTY